MKIFEKIGTRLILTVSFTVIVIISVFAYFNIKSHSDNLISEVERHANQLSETVKNTMQFDMLLNNREHIARVIKTVAKEEGIKYIRILNKKGEIIYRLDNENGLIDNTIINLLASILFLFFIIYRKH